MIQSIGWAAKTTALSFTYPCLLRDPYKQPHSSMFSLSSPLALKGHLKLNTTTNVLLVVFLLTLYITSCEARQLRIHAKNSSKLSSLQPKDLTETVDDAEGQMRSSPEVPVRSIMDSSSMGKEMVVELKKEVASSGASSRYSVRKRLEGIKARSGMRERSMLGADSKSDLQVGSNATTAYAEETLVAMDYLDAHPAPAVHNK